MCILLCKSTRYDMIGYISLVIKLNILNHIMILVSADYSYSITGSTVPPCHSSNVTFSAADSTSKLSQLPSYTLWHTPLGHPHHAVLHRVLKKLKIPVLSSAPAIFCCEPCTLGKLHHISFLSTSPQDFSTFTTCTYKLMGSGTLSFY